MVFQNALSNKSSGLGGTKTQEIVKSELDKLKERIEEDQFYGRITIQQELDLYEEFQPTTDEERKEVDRAILSRLRTISAAQSSYIDDRTKAEEDAVKRREELYKEEGDLRTKYAQDVLAEYKEY